MNGRSKFLFITGYLGQLAYSLTNTMTLKLTTKIILQWLQCLASWDLTMHPYGRQTLVAITCPLSETPWGYAIQLKRVRITIPFLSTLLNKFEVVQRTIFGCEIKDEDRHKSEWWEHRVFVRDRGFATNSLFEHSFENQLVWGDCPKY